MLTMMMVKKVLSAFAVMALLFTCHPNRDFERVGFSKAVNVNASLDSIKANSQLLLERKLVSTVKNIVSLGSDDSLLFKVFDSQSGTYKGGFGRYGEGPEEILYPFPSGLNSYGDKFSIGDLHSIRTIPNFDQQIEDNNGIKISQHILYPDNYIPLNYPFFLNDTTVCGQAEISEKQLSCFNINTLEKFNYIDYPMMRKDIPVNANHHLYQNHVTMTPDRRKIVFAYSYFPLIKIYDVTTMVETDIHYQAQHNQKEKILLASDNMSVNILDMFSYYSNIAVSDRFIYAFYYESEIKLSDDNSSEMITIPLSAKQIHVFSMDGNPVAKIVLEEWMKVFTVTQDDRFLYFTHPEKEDYLFRFSLQSIIS